MFSEKEVDYINAQGLAGIATSGTDLQADVAAVGFDFDGQFFYVGSMMMEKTNKYKNIIAGNNKVALIIDDMESFEPWMPRGIKVFGTADIVEREGYAGEGKYLRITPSRSWTWGIEGPAFQDNGWTTIKVTW
ncbi:MAG: PPOX class F420-dependent oxidoreductase [Anaerolineaceae bacterium]|nr:MAG: PPOX class F420-dependent oxidoreductase [Anaerolineaceae bacterium]